MGSEWKVVRLGDFISVKHGYAFKGDDFSEANIEGSIVVTIGNFDYTGGFRFESTKIKRCNNEYPAEYELLPGDILLVMTCQTEGGEILGIPGIIPDNNETYLHNQRLGKVIIKSNDISSKYLYWLFMCRDFNLYLCSTASGTKILHTAPKRIESYTFDCPPLPEQKAIAHILGSLDDKIELNRRMNATLEGMAQALFKSWFVDFDPVIDNAILAGNSIPDEFAERAEVRRAILDKKQNSDLRRLNTETEKASLHNSSFNTHHSLFPAAFQFTEEMGWIPEGWGVVRVNQLLQCYIDNRGKTPPLSDTGIPLIEVKHITDDSIVPNFITDKYVNAQTYETWFRSHLNTDDIVISTVGTIGRICMVVGDRKFVIAQNLLGLRFKKEKASAYYMYYQMKNFKFKHDVDARLVITVQPSIKRKDLETIDLLSPSIKIQTAFEAIVKNLIRKQTSGQNDSLTNLRDILLPKLISGELSVPHAEKMIKDEL